nr:hypothetical protein [Tanacetum cinerariifolium]
MANLSEGIQSASSDTRPPMLDRSDFASWQQCIRMYCLGKDNGENIIKSINEGPFKIRKINETIIEGSEGAVRPERDRVVADLTHEEKERYKDDIRTTNILLQGYELTKDDRESQLYDEFEHFCQNKGETIHEYYHEAHANENKMMLERYNRHAIDYKAYKIPKSDYKNMHPNDFEDLYLLHLQGKLKHLSGSDKVNLFNADNIWIRNIVIRKRVEDFQLGIESYQTKLN